MRRLVQCVMILTCSILTLDNAATKCVHAAIIEQEFTNAWSVDVWDHYGYVAARHWQYQPYSTFDSSLGTLKQVEVQLNISLSEATIGDTFRFRAGFFTGWNPADWQFAADEWFDDIPEQMEIERTWVFSSAAELSHWTDPLYGPGGHHYFESTTLDNSHTVESSTRLIFEYEPIPLPASGLIWLGLFGSMVVAGWWRLRKHA